MVVGRRKPALSSLAALVASLVLLGGATARAEPSDAVEGRLTISAAYGFDAVYYQDQRASTANPAWGHGFFFRLGGERCGVLCVGLSVLGAVGVSPEGSGAIGVGPHIAYRFGGPDWAGPYNFRVGAAYYYSFTSIASVSDQGELVFGDVRGSSGVGLWFSIGLELRRRPAFWTPIIGIRGRYVAVIPPSSADPESYDDTPEHHLSAEVFLGVSFGRRLVFGQGEELDVEQPEVEPEGRREGAMELDEEEERILREAEDELRR